MEARKRLTSYGRLGRLITMKLVFIFFLLVAALMMPVVSWGQQFQPKTQLKVKPVGVLYLTNFTGEISWDSEKNEIIGLPDGMEIVGSRFFTRIRPSGEVLPQNMVMKYHLDIINPPIVAVFVRVKQYIDLTKKHWHSDTYIFRMENGTSFNVYLDPLRESFDFATFEITGVTPNL